MRLPLESLPTKERRERPYTRLELSKMRRRLLEDCDIYEKRAQLTKTNAHESYRAILEAVNDRIEKWIQKQLQHPERYHSIILERPRSSKSPRGTVAFLLDDGSSFSIQEPDVFHDHHYTKGMIGFVFSQHVFLTEDASYQLIDTLSRPRGVMNILKKSWDARSQEPGAILVQYNPSELDAKGVLKNGRFSFIASDKPEYNPRFEDASFTLETTLTIGKPIQRILQKGDKPAHEKTYVT